MLAGSLALASEPAQAADECGAVSGSGNTRTVACGSDLPNGVTYTRQNGLDMTVGADGAPPIEIKPPANGAGVKVESWKTDTGNLVVTVFPVEIVQNDQNNGKKGIDVGQRGTGGAEVKVRRGAKLGADGAPLSDQGITVWYGAESTALLKITSDGSIFVDGASDRNGAGIYASRNGAGNIEIIHGGEIDSQSKGIYAYHGGAGGIYITHSGSIVSKDWGIFVRKDAPGGKVKIVSRGDITATGANKAGINVDVRAPDAVEPVEVAVERGTIKATGHGVAVTSGSLGAVTVEVMSDGSIGILAGPVGGDGVYVSITNAASQEALKIVSEGKIFAEGHGIYAAHSGTGAIEIVNKGSISAKNAGIRASRNSAGKIRITQEGDIVSQNRGIYAYHGGAGAIEIIHSGSIVSEDWGIFARKDAAGGKIRIVSRGNIETTGDNKPGIKVDVRAADAADAAEPVGVTVERGTIKATGHGVAVSNRGLGAVTIELGTNGSIGASDSRVGGNGINVSIANPANRELLKIVIDGRIFAGADGIGAFRDGIGAIQIVHTGEIDVFGSGIRASHSGAGAIRITLGSGGQINALGKGIDAYHSGAGAILITHEGNIHSLDSGILVRRDAPGGGGVEIVSRGDIQTEGDSKDGIKVDVRAADAAEPVDVTVERGTIKATGHGVAVSNRGLGAVTIELGANGSIGVSGSRVGGNGINVSIANPANRELLKIASDGRIFAGATGIRASRNGAGALEIVLDRGGRINAVGKGIDAYHSGSGAIRIHANGGILSGIDAQNYGAVGQMIGWQGYHAGINARHDGAGAIEIRNTADIAAGGVGIRAHRRNAGTIDITHEGDIESKDHGIFARHDGSGANGGITVTSRGDITTTGYRKAGIDAQSKGQDATGDVFVKHEKGRIESHVGIVVRSMRSSGSRFELPPSPQGFPPREKRQVKLHVISGGEIKARRMAYDPNLDEARSEHQVGWKVRALLPSFDGPAGIVVGTIDSQRKGEYIAAGDARSTGLTDAELDALITDEVRTQFRAVLKAAKDFRGSPGSEMNLGHLFDPRSLLFENFPPSPDGGYVLPGDLSEDADLDAWLKANGGAVLLKFLRYTVSEKEAAVLEALFKKEGLDAALAALPDTYTDDYKNQIRWLAESYNDANTLIEVVDGGRIESEGDGVTVTYKLEDKNNGRIVVKVERGAVVTAHRYGVEVEGAGIDGRGTPGTDDDIRDQTVEVRGRVESTGADGAGIHMVGGGTVIVGPEGTVIAKSGTSVIANDPGLLVVEIETQEDESPTDAAKRAIPGRIVNKIDRTELKFVEPDGTVLSSATGAGSKNAVMDGAFDVGLSATDGGVRIVSDHAPRSRVYEALPSVLLGMNGVPGYRARANAPRARNGMWARMTAGAGSRKPAESTSSVSYRHRWIGLDAGKDFSLGGNHNLGVSLHHRIGSADVRRGGDIDATGTGMGLSYTWATDRYHVDLHAAATFYEASLKSSVRGKLTSDRPGFGHAFGIEAGHRIDMDGVAVTPSLGLTYSSVKLRGFTDRLGMKVSSLGGWNLKSRMAVGIEKPFEGGRLLGSLGLEHELGGKAGAVVSGTKLSSTARATMLRLGGGVVFDNPDRGASLFTGINYGTDGKRHEIRGTLALRF